MALLVQLRDELRKKREWALADMIREELKALGYILDDRKEGTIWRKV